MTIESFIWNLVCEVSSDFRNFLYGYNYVGLFFVEKWRECVNSLAYFTTMNKLLAERLSNGFGCCETWIEFDEVRWLRVDLSQKCKPLSNTYRSFVMSPTHKPPN